MMAWGTRPGVLGLLVGSVQGVGLQMGAGLMLGAQVRQTPEELGLDDVTPGEHSEFSDTFCLDLGARGFPLPVVSMLQAADWDAFKYFDTLDAKGYAEDALMMTGPSEAILKADCMKVAWKGRTKHIFVGDSQMMSLRNAFHRLHKCPELWWHSSEAEASRTRAMGRLHSSTHQAPDEALPKGCTEEGIASFLYWDAYAEPELPIEAIKREMELLGLDPINNDNVVIWLGSNYIRPKRRKSTMLRAINEMQVLGVKLIWDSPTYQDAALMTAASTHDAGLDPANKVPIIFSAISQRKAKGDIGSNQYEDERALQGQAYELAMTKRWQLTNRYRGLQCDGIHTDMRGRDPLFDLPCPAGPAPAYGASTYCNWVEPVRANLSDHCPSAIGVDDMVLQSGLYAMCAGHERPFCYQHAGDLS